MGCTQAELFRLLEFIDREVFSATTLSEARRRWNAIKNHLEELSLEEFRALTGL